MIITEGLAFGQVQDIAAESVRQGRLRHERKWRPTRGLIRRFRGHNRAGSPSALPWLVVGVGVLVLFAVAGFQAFRGESARAAASDPTVVLPGGHGLSDDAILGAALLFIVLLVVVRGALAHLALVLIGAAALWVAFDPPIDPVLRTPGGSWSVSFSTSRTASRSCGSRARVPVRRARSRISGRLPST